LGGQMTGLAKKKVLESFGSEDPKAKSLQNSKVGGVLRGEKMFTLFPTRTIGMASQILVRSLYHFGTLL
jgi:hypothetical protein